MTAAVRMEKDGPLAILTLDRPESRNPLGEPGDGALFQDICDAINADRTIRCAILTGAGSAFSAGGNVKNMQARAGQFSGGPAAIAEGYRKNIHRIARALYGLDVPLVAAVNGPAIGLGCDMACFADIRIASEKARFGVTFLKVGLIPGDGGAWILQRMIGLSRAAELLYTGDLIDAETAAKWGLASRVVPHEKLMDEARALALKIAQQPPDSLRLTKMLLRQAGHATYDQILELSAVSQALVQGSAHNIEGVTAVIEKRPPVFKDD